MRVVEGGGYGATDDHLDLSLSATYAPLVQQEYIKLSVSFAKPNVVGLYDWNCW